MKRTLLALDIVIVLLLIVGCESFKKPPPALATANKGQPAPLVAASDAAKEATKKADAAAAELERQRKERESLIKARVSAARSAATGNQFVEMELALVETELAEVTIDPAEFDAALARKGLLDAGQIEHARKAYSIAAAASQKRTEARAVAVVAFDTAITERNAKTAAVTAEIIALNKKLEDNKRANQKVLEDLQHQHEEELEKERKAFMRTIGYVLMGVGVVLLLIAVLIVYSGVKSGDPFKSIVKAAVFAGGFVFCFVCAWTINQWWFKWVIIIGGSLGIVAVIAYVWTEWREGQEKKQRNTRTVEADESEATLKKVMAVMDKILPKDHPAFAELTGSMNDNEKALILELKAEEKRKPV